MPTILKRFPIFFGAFLLAVFSNQTVFADGLNIGVSPIIMELQADPGETISEIINVSGDKDNCAPLNTIVKDFYYDEEGELQFLTQEELEDSDLKKFTLKGWLTVDDKILLEEECTKKVPITIQVPVDAAAGGRYGMILFSKSSSKENGDGGANLGVGGQVGVMILVTVKGEYTSGGEISEKLESGRLSEEGTSFDSKTIFAAGALFKNGPFDFKFRYQNNSATHVVPQGNISVKNIFGGLVDTFSIDGKRVFPGGGRVMYGSLKKDFLFGIYSADLKIIDGDGNIHNSSTFFIALPLKLILISILLIIAIFMFFKYYNKWLINKALKQYGKGHKAKK